MNSKLPVIGFSLLALLLVGVSSCTPSVVTVPSPDGNLSINLSRESGQFRLSID